MYRIIQNIVWYNDHLDYIMNCVCQKIVQKILVNFKKLIGQTLQTGEHRSDDGNGLVHLYFKSSHHSSRKKRKECFVHSEILQQFLLIFLDEFLRPLDILKNCYVFQI
jgi:hypothetical protein